MPPYSDPDSDADSESEPEPEPEPDLDPESEYVRADDICVPDAAYSLILCKFAANAPSQHSLMTRLIVGVRHCPRGITSTVNAPPPLMSSGSSPHLFAGLLDRTSVAYDTCMPIEER